MLVVTNTLAHLDMEAYSFHQWDYDKYDEIMHSANALTRNNVESETKPKANRSWKWKHILKPICDEKISIQETV